MYQLHCPYCTTPMRQVKGVDEDYCWCSQCNEFWYVTTVEPSQIPSKIYWRMIDDDHARLLHWNARVEGELPLE